MKLHNVKQGTQEWLDLRAKHFTASEAAAMMGACKYKTRDQLLHEKKTGQTQEADRFAQKRFDAGHESEAKARPIVEALIGEELYPVVGTNGDLLASFDGLTMTHEVDFEHKLWNEDLAEAVRNRDLPASHYWQLEQQLLVSGAKKIIFVVSDGTEEKMEHMEYTAVPGRAEELVAGWNQFKKDLETYEPQSVSVEPTANPIKDLPALHIELTGSVNRSNLATYEQNALALIESINTNLQTDQDFVNAESMVKFCKETEDKLDAAKDYALGQTADIDELFKTIDNLRETMRQKRLALDKLVKSRKEEIKGDLVREKKAEIEEFVKGLCTTDVRVPCPQTDFYAAIKGKKKLDAMNSALNDELARAKIEATKTAEKITSNIEAFNELATDHHFLFNDLIIISLHEPDAFLGIVKSRITEYETQQAAKAEREKAEKAITTEAPEITQSNAEVDPIHRATSDWDVVQLMCDHLNLTLDRTKKAAEKFTDPEAKTLVTRVSEELTIITLELAHKLKQAA